MNSTTGRGETHENLAIRQAVTTGAAAGANIAVPGIKVGDSLKAVAAISLVEGVPNTVTAANHDPNAFAVGAGVISSATTGTGGQTLFITYISRHPRGGDLTRS